MDDTNVIISLHENEYEWLTIENGVLTGVLPDTLIENIEFKIKVEDQGAQKKSRIYTYQLDIEPNARPVLQDLQLIFESELNNNYIAPYFDSDNDNVTFSIELSDSSIDWITIDSNTGVVSGTSPDTFYNNSGDPITITVIASDGKINVQKQFTLLILQEPFIKQNAVTSFTFDEDSVDQEIELNDIFGPDDSTLTFNIDSVDTNEISPSIEGTKLKLSFILFEHNAAIAGEAVIKTHVPDIVQTVMNFKKFVFNSSNLLSLPSFITL